MSNIIETLTEGIVNRNVAAEGKALLDKWTATGLLEGLETEHSRATMARLLENQAKELLRESSSMSGGDVQGFAAVAFPIVRRVFAGLIANDLVSVQPMSLPSGLIFFMDFVFSPTLNGSEQAAGSDRFGNTVDRSIYGTDRVGSQITGGVNLVGTYSESLSGPRESVGYAYASPTGSTAIATTEGNCTPYTLANMTEVEKKLIKFDADILADSDILSVYVYDELTVTEVGALADYDNLSAFTLELSGTATGMNKEFAVTCAGIATDAAAGTLKLVRRLTDKYQVAGVDYYRFVLVHLTILLVSVVMQLDFLYL